MYVANGFTLLELMVVCALLATLAGLGAAQLAHWHWRTQYHTEVMSIRAHVESAKARAQLQQQDTWLGVTPTCLWIADHDQADCASAAVYTRPQALAWRAEFAGGSLLRFTAGRGMAGFSAGRLVVSDTRFRDHQTHLVVSALGRLRLCQDSSLLSQVPVC